MWEELPTEIWAEICKFMSYADLGNLSGVCKNLYLVVKSINDFGYARDLRNSRPGLISWCKSSCYPKEITFNSRTIPLHTWDDKYNFIDSCVYFLNSATNTNKIVKVIEWLVNYVDEKMIAELMFHHSEISQNVPMYAFMVYASEYPPKQLKFNPEVLRKEYFSLFNIHCSDSYTALNNLLSKINLPGETSIFDRVLQYYSVQVHENCTDRAEFTDVDAVRYHMFSLVMLYTDAVVPFVKKKMQKEEFANINSPAIGCSKELAAVCYDRIYSDGLGFVFITHKVYIKKKFPARKVPASLKLKLVHTPTVSVWKLNITLFTCSLQDCDVQKVPEKGYIALFRISKPKCFKVFCDEPAELESAYLHLVDARLHTKNEKITNDPVEFLLSCK